MLRGLRFLKWAGRSERRKSKPRKNVFGLSSHHRRLLLEPLESRMLLTSVQVNMTTDIAYPSGSGEVSLRNAIATANASATPTTITFSPTISGQAIVLTSELELSNTSDSTTITGPAAGMAISGLSLGIDSNVTATLANLIMTNALTYYTGSIWNCGTLTLTNASISGGSEDAICNSGTATLTNVTISGNDNGDGFSNSGTATLTNVTVSGNGINGCSSAVYMNGGTMTLTDCTVSGNNGDYAGGISVIIGNLTLINSTVSDNTSSSSAGGISIYEGSTADVATLTNSTVSDNVGAWEGGGIYSYGTLNLTGCTVSGNTATGDGNGDGGGLGGGICNVYGTTTLINTTISDNTAPGASSILYNYGGGGIYNDTDGTMALTNVTVSGNSVTGGVGTGSGGGGISNAAPAANFTIANSIVAGNSTGNYGPDAYGSFNSLGHNLIRNTNNSSGWNAADLTGSTASPLNPELGPLADNGGPTQTMALLPGSPAIDAGSNSLAVDASDNPLVTDQRGLTRIVNGTVDIGAYERAPGGAPTVTGASTTTAAGTYGVGTTIPITLTFSEAVTVLGTPQLTLNDGGAADYDASESSSTALTFDYTVAAGQDTTDLDYASTGRHCA